MSTFDDDGLRPTNGYEEEDMATGDVQRDLGRLEGAHQALEARVNRTDVAITELKAEMNGRFSAMEKAVSEKLSGVETNLGAILADQNKQISQIVLQTARRDGEGSAWKRLSGMAWQLIVSAAAGAAGFFIGQHK